MPLAIITSHSQSRHTILLALNITGVILCICTKTLLVLAALGVIFQEPDVSPVIDFHIKTFINMSLKSMKEFDQNMPAVEDGNLFYLSNLDVLLSDKLNSS